MNAFMHALPLYAFIALSLWVIYAMCHYAGRDEIIIYGVFDSSGRRLDRVSILSPQPAYARSRVNYQFEAHGPGAQLMHDEHGRITGVTGPCRLRISNR